MSVGFSPEEEQENDKLIEEVMSYDASFEKRLKVLVFKARFLGMKDGVRYVQNIVNTLGETNEN